MMSAIMMGKSKLKRVIGVALVAGILGMLTAQFGGGGGDGGGGVGSWSAISSARAPGPRCNPSAVWTGSEMLVWGGCNNSGNLNTGFKYNPTTDSWASITTTGAPPAVSWYHTAVWTGTEMIVWGIWRKPGGRYWP